jgi:hypothetical protein
MVEDHKKSESDSESELKDKIWRLTNHVIDLQDRVLALEKALMHAQHTNTDDGSRHQNDGGWFD